MTTPLRCHSEQGEESVLPRLLLKPALVDQNDHYLPIGGVDSRAASTYI